MDLGIFRFFRRESQMIERCKRVGWEHFVIDAFLMVISGYASAYVVLGHDLFNARLGLITAWIFLSIPVRFAVFVLNGVYDSIWRYTSLTDAVKLASALFVSGLVLFTVYVSFYGLGRLSPFIFIINMLQLLVLLSAVRVGRRIVHEHRARKKRRDKGRATLIYGAGVNGRTLASRFMMDDALRSEVIGFIDDDQKKIGHMINGVRVLSSRKDLAKILSQYRVEELVIAIPNLPGEAVRETMHICKGFSIRPRLMASPRMDSRDTIDLVREVALDDLLARPFASIDLSAIREYCHKKRVLITGAGGSIGSEIARQVFEFRPERLMILDSSEFALYLIDQDLRGGSSDISTVAPVLVDLKNRASLDAAMKQHQPQVVFHAAAYKHVHLVEYNPASSILNNIGGTWNLLEACQRVGVETFVQISTDKAVNPVGAMGATKRVCELMVSRVGQKTGKRYCTVRFGNVVGSSGSLLQLLKKQIRKGGPITITHENMTRYFMRIREAVSLVLKSASIAQPGDICILKMGDPIKILDIAKSLIMLLGKKESEIPIEFIGARPGEKLHEELYLTGEEISTEHPDILVLPKGAQQSITPVQQGASLDTAIAQLLAAAEDEERHNIVKMLLAIAQPAGFSAKALITGSTGHELCEQELRAVR